MHTRDFRAVWSCFSWMTVLLSRPLPPWRGSVLSLRLGLLYAGSSLYAGPCFLPSCVLVSLGLPLLCPSVLSVLWSHPQQISVHQGPGGN